MHLIKQLNRFIIYGLTIIMLFGHSTASAARKRGRNNKYLTINQTFTNQNEAIDLSINRKSLNLDLARTQNIRIRLKPTDLYKSNERINSFKVDIYEIYDGDRRFISSQNVTFYRGSRKSRIISLDAGKFDEPTKDIEIDVYDTTNSLVSSYSTEISAFNLESQVSGSSFTVPDAICDSDSFGECHLDYVFSKIKFEAKPQRQISTRIIKSDDGLYKVTIPVPRSRFNFLGRKIRRKERNGGSSTLGASSVFGSILEAGQIKVGPNSSMYGGFSYDSTNNQIEIGFEPGDSNTFTFDHEGLLGIGVDPAAYLHVQASDGTYPSIVLNPGTLTSPAVDGAFEYDGSKLYFTSGGTREELGAQGPAGPQGPIGLQGPQGLQGPTGTFNGDTLNDVTLNGTTTINGPMVFNSNGSVQGNMTVNGIVFADQFNGGNFYGAFFGNGAGLTNIANTIINNGSIINGTTINTYIDNSTYSNGTIINTFVNNGSYANGNIYSTTINNSTINSTTYANGTILNTFVNNGNYANGTVTNTSITNSTVNNTTFANGSVLNTFINNGNYANGSISSSQITNNIITGNTINNNTINGTLTFNSNGMLQDATLNGTTNVSGNINVSGSINGTTLDLDFSNGSVVFSDQNGVLREDNNNFFWDRQNNRLALGRNDTNELLTVNGTLSLLSQSSAPAATSGFGKIFVNGDVLYFRNGSGAITNLLSSGGGDADTLDTLDSTEFLRANATDSYTGANTLTIAAAATLDIDGTLDIDSTAVSIADTNISLDGASTTFTQTTGGIGFTPAAGQDLDINISGLGDFNVGTDKLTVDNNGNVGISNLPANEKLTVNGSVSLISQSSAPAATSGYGKLFVNGDILYFRNGNGAITNLLAGGGDADTLDTLDSTDFLRSNASDSYTGANTLTIAAAATLDIDGTLDIDSTDVTIADTDIILDGASTTFNGSTGAITLLPAANNNLNVNLSGTGDLVVNTNMLYVDTSAARVGIGDTSPVAELDVGGGTADYVDGTDDIIVADDLEIDDDLFVNDDATVNGTLTALNLNGTTLNATNANINTLNATTLNTNYTPGSVLFANATGDIAEDNANLFWGDAANRLGIGTANPDADLTINGAGAYIFMRGDNGGGMEGISYLDSSGANRWAFLLPGNDIVTLTNRAVDGVVQIRADDGSGGGGGETIVAQFEDNQIRIGGTTPGNTDIILYRNGSGLFNEQGAAVDFRVEGDTDPNMIFGDGSADNVGIGHSAPNEKLTVNGNIALAEQGAAPGNTSGFGKIYVSSGNSKLYFRDDGGTIFNLTNGTGSTTEWSENVGALHPADNAGEQDVLIGGTTAGAADIILDNGGNAIFNEQGKDKDFRIEGDTDLDLFFVDASTDEIGIGRDDPNELLTVNGTISMLNLSSAPTATAGFGKLFSNGNILYYRNGNGAITNLLAGGSGGDANTLDTLDSTDFLRSNATDSYTGANTLTIAAAATLDIDGTLNIDSTAVSIADTDITLDGASTTFTQTTGAITLVAANGSNLNFRLDGLSDFVVDTDKFIVDNNGNIGLSYTPTNALLTVNGAASLREISTPASTSNFGKIYVSSGNSKLYFRDDGGTIYNLTNGTGSTTEWTENSGALHPADNAGEQDVLIGGTSAGAADIILDNGGNAIFNEQGKDKDFRVEGDTDINLIFADASSERVGIGVGAASISHKLEVNGGILALTFNGNFIGNGRELTGIAQDNGDTVVNQTVNNSTVNNTDIYNSTVHNTTVNGTISFTGNGMLQDATLNGDTTVSGNINVSGSINGTTLDLDFSNGSVVFSDQNGVLRESNNKFYWDRQNDRLGIGRDDPNELLTVNGTISMLNLSSAPAATSGFGKLFSNGNILYYRNGNGAITNLLAGGSDADTLDTLDSTDFLRSNATDSYTGANTLTIAAAATLDIDGTLDIDSTAVSIADTDITLDGASTTFTQTTGGIGFAPANGGDLTVTLLGPADLEVDVNKFVIENNGNVGIGVGTGSIDAKLEVNGNTLISGDINTTGTVNGTNFDLDFSNGSIVFSDQNGVLRESNNKLFWDRQNDRLGIGRDDPNELLTVNGVVSILEVSGAPGNTSGFGKLYVDSTTSNLYFLDEAGTPFDLLTGGGGGGGGNGHWMDAGSVLRPADASGEETVIIGGTGVGSADIILYNGGNAVFNEQGKDKDFRVEGDTDINLIFADASSERVGIGVGAASISHKLEVNGGILALTFNGNFIGNGRELTGIAQDNGDTVVNQTINNSTVNNTDIYNSTIHNTTVNGTISFTGNGMLQDATLNGDTTVSGNINVSGSINGTTLDLDFSNGSVVFSDQNGVLRESNNKLFWDRQNDRLGIGRDDPNELLTVNGTISMLNLSSAPAATSGFGKLFSNGNILYYRNGNGAITNLLAEGGDADTLDTLDSTDFLRANATDSYTGANTLTIAAAATLDIDGTLDIDSTAVSIADTDITLDGASTTFTQTTGGIGFAPANGGDLTVTLLGPADLEVDVNKFVIENNGNVGIGVGTGSIDAKLEVNGGILALTFNGNFIGNGRELTGIAQDNGDTVVNQTINNSTVNNTDIYNSTIHNTTVNGTISFTGNGMLQDATLNGDTTVSGNINVSGSINGTTLDLDFSNGSVVFSDQNGVLRESNNKLFWDRQNDRLGIGRDDPNELLTVNGTISMVNLSSAPAATSGFGKLFSNGNILYYRNGNGAITNLLAGGGGGGDADTLDSLDSTQFLRSDATDSYTGANTLTISSSSTLDVDGTLDIDSTSVSIADPDITFDAASTTFTQSSGAMTMSPAAGSDFNLSLSGAGDFLVNINDFVVDTSAGLVGINEVAPDAMLEISTLTSSEEGLHIKASAGQAAALLKITDSSDRDWIVLDTNGAAIFNENGLAADFRVESDSDENALFVQGTNGNVGIGHSAPNTKLTVNGNIALANQSSAPTATSGFGKLFVNGDILYFRNGSGAITNLLAGGGGGSSEWTENSGALHPADSSGEQDILVGGTTAGAADIILDNGGNAVFNEQGKSKDFRVEGSGETHALFVQGSDGNIGVGDVTPDAKLDINGSLALAPSSTQSLNAGDSITVSNSIIKIAGNGGAVNLTSNPQISDGADGQIIILKGTHNTNTVTLDDGTGLSLTNGISVTLGNKDTLVLMYDLGDDEWIEISRSNK